MLEKDGNEREIDGESEHGIQRWERDGKRKIWERELGIIDNIM